jgi:nucleoside-diphosphate-sugar epimerase
MLHGQPPIINGDGTQTRDFVYVDDVVRANLLICEREEAIGEVYNVATGRGVSLLDLVAVLNELLQAHLVPVFEAPRAGDIKHSRGDNTKGAARLGFLPAVAVKDGLAQVLNDFQRG